MTLTQLISSGANASDVGGFLSSLAPEERMAQVRSIAADYQRRLWEVCEGATPYTVDELVPHDGRVVFAGRNSLRTFSLFEKRFTREKGNVSGYNAHPLQWLIGHGCFRPLDTPEGLVFDYSAFPSNSFGAARLVYHGLRDVCRRVTDDVLVGAAWRHGQPLQAYFVIARLA